MKQLNRFLNTKKVIYFTALKELLIKNEKTLSEDRGVENIYGMYEIFDNELYAILSLNNRNFLFLKDEFVEITESVHIDCKVNWSKKEPSYFEVFHDKRSLIKVDFINEHEPVLSPFDMIENWEEVNFGYELASMVEKVKNTPELILFPTMEYSNIR